MENESLIPKMNTPTVFFTLAAIAISISGLIYFSGILKPLVMAFLVWFVINQLKITIGKIKIRNKTLPPIICSISSFIIILLTMYLSGTFLIYNIQGIIASMPEYLEKLDNSADKATAFINDPVLAEYLKQWFSELDFAGMATSIVNSLSDVVANSFVVIIYIIFFIIEDATLRIKVEKLFPGKGKHFVIFKHHMGSMNAAIRSYFLSKTIISLITAAVSYITLLILDVDYAFLWSFLVFTLNYIPYIGPFISSVIPAVFAVLISGDFIQFVYVFATLELIQVVIGNFIEPILMGKGTNLSPAVVVVALAFWGMIWGMVGMILAVPVTAVFVVVLSQIPATRYLAVLLSEKGTIPDIEG